MARESLGRTYTHPPTLSRYRLALLFTQSKMNFICKLLKSEHLGNGDRKKNNQTTAVCCVSEIWINSRLFVMASISSLCPASVTSVRRGVRGDRPPRYLVGIFNGYDDDRRDALSFITFRRAFLLSFLRRLEANGRSSSGEKMQRVGWYK